MAVLYVRSTDGDDADNGSTWALAKATLAGAFAAAAAGDTIYVSHQHSESQASAMTLTSPGTAANPCRVLCVNDGAEPPTTLATTALIKTTGSYGITFLGYAYFYGITFRAAEGGASGNILFGTGATQADFVFDNCRLEAMGTSSTLNRSGYHVITYTLKDTVVKFGGASGYINLLSMEVNWFGGSLDVSSAVPNFLFKLDYGGLARLVGVDLSGLNTKLVSIYDGAHEYIYLTNCRTNASMGLLYSAISYGSKSAFIFSDRSDSGDTNYKIDHRKFEGSIVTETTIKRTGGASDGTTAYCWKMVSLSTPQFFWPLESPPIAVWNETVGSALTLTVEILHDSTTALKDDEVWVEVEYLGTSGYPKSSIASDRKTDILATAANQDSSSADWTTTGLSNPNKQKLVATFTPQEKGPLVARVMLAKPSYTIYVCPKVTVA